MSIRHISHKPNMLQRQVNSSFVSCKLLKIACTSDEQRLLAELRVRDIEREEQRKLQELEDNAETVPMVPVKLKGYIPLSLFFIANIHDFANLPPFPLALKSDATHGPRGSSSGFEYLPKDFSSLGTSPK